MKKDKVKIGKDDSAEAKKTTRKRGSVFLEMIQHLSSIACGSGESVQCVKSLHEVHQQFLHVFHTFEL